MENFENDRNRSGERDKREYRERRIETKKARNIEGERELWMYRVGETGEMRRK